MHIKNNCRIYIDEADEKGEERGNICDNETNILSFIITNE